ncbi:MAG: MBL fold metallo-hydrolase [Pseudomonadales bacterium]
MEETVAGSGIHTVDAAYQRDDAVAIHLVQSGSQLALVDTGTNHSVQNTTAAIKSLGLSWDDVRYIILTHVHLDHAGGAGEMMKLAANAECIVHARGARHMIDPGKLIAGSNAVYGEETVKQLYGDIVPIDESRIIVPVGNEVIDFNERPLKFIDTPGHAYHHHCIWDERSRSMFTGDTLGVCYKSLRNDNTAFLLPTTSPVQFDPKALHASIDRVMAFKPEYLYLTHFSSVKPDAIMIQGLHEQIDAMVEMTQAAAEQSELGPSFESDLSAKIVQYLLERCRAVLPDVSDAAMQEWLPFDAELNAQGLAFWWRYRRDSVSS